MNQDNRNIKSNSPILFSEHLKAVNDKLDKSPELLTDKLWRVQNLYPIQDKTGRLVPFFLNEHQWKLVDLIKKKWSEPEPEPLVVLKSRQVGITTLFAIWNLDQVLTYTGVSSAIQAGKWDQLNSIFRIVHLAYNNMHPIYKKPQTDKFSRSTRNEIVIGENNSFIEVVLEVRGKAVNHMHYSEFAFTDEDRAIATQGSMTPGCLTVYESSPKGLNRFHRLYRTNKAKGNCFFIPWWKHSEYSFPCPDGLPKKTDDEKKIQKDYPEISDEKLLYRRKKLDEMEMIKFEQEYPLNDVECFLLSGASLLDRRLLAELERKAEKIKSIEKVKLPNFEITFYEKPKKEDLEKEPRAFFVGVDTAEGIGQDYSGTIVLSVNEKHEVKQVMVGHGFLSPDDHAKETYRLVKENFVFDGVWPFLVCERNNTGHAFLSTLLNQEDYWYPNLYYYKDKRVGFRTTAVSRKIILHDLFNAIRDGSLELRDLKTIGELMTLTLTDAKKIEAEKGEHDDLVFSNAFAYHGYFWTLGMGRGEDEDEQTQETDALDNTEEEKKAVAVRET